MSTQIAAVVIHDIPCECPSAFNTQIHHRDFPEIWAEGRTLSAAVEQLVHALTRALEGAGYDWHRDHLKHALGEVEELLAELRRDEARPSAM